MNNHDNKTTGTIFNGINLFYFFLALVGMTIGIIVGNRIDIIGPYIGGLIGLVLGIPIAFIILFVFIFFVFGPKEVLGNLWGKKK